MITLESAGKQFGAAVAVHDLSFTVEQGEIVGFLGPNGAGKTTTLRMIAGYLTPTSGRVTVAGHDMASARVDAARHIGYLPERPPLYNHLDVRGYLRFVAKSKGIRGRSLRAELERVCAACHLETVFRQAIYKLSKGFRQRVGLAQALLGNPAVLLLDEPTNGLDPEQMHETRELIRACGETQAVLLSTHLLSEATAICQRIAIIDRGRLLAVDSPEGLAQAVEQTQRVRLRVRGPAAGLEAALKPIEGVRLIRVEAIPGADDQLELVCEVPAREGVEASIARAVVQGTGAGKPWELLRLHRQQVSLEQIFLHYVATARRPASAP